MDVRFAAGRAWVYGAPGLYGSAGPGEPSLPVLGAEVLKLDEAEAEPWLLAVKPSGEGGYVLDGAGELLEFHLDAAKADSPARYQRVDRRTYALELLDEKHWALATRESRNIVVRTGLPGAENVRLKSPRSVDKTPWPEGLLWEDADDVPYTRRKRFSETPDRLRLRAFRGSVALADADAGIVGLWQDGNHHWTWISRVPIGEDARLEAWPFGGDAGTTPAGAVAHLSLASKKGRDVLLQLDGEGLIVATKEVGAVQAAVADGTHVYFVRDGGLHRWAPATQDPEQLLDTGSLGMPTTTEATSASASASASAKALLRIAGDRLLYSEGTDVSWLHREDGGWKVSAIEPPGRPPAKKARLAKPKKRRLKGEPRLQLDGSIDPEPWVGHVGDLSVEVPVVNMGGPADGLTIEVAGPALGTLYEATTVEVRSAGWRGAIELPLERGRATLDKSIAAGVEIPDPPKSIARKKSDAKQWRWEQIPDDARICVKVRGRAIKKGQSLLTIRIGLHDLGRAGSVLRGQSLTIE